MEEDGSIPIDGCDVIAFHAEDGKPLFGVYPPILTYSGTHVIRGLALDGYMALLHATYTKDLFRSEAKAGNIILLDKPIETPASPVVLCVPPEEREIFNGVLDLQRAKNADTYTTVLSLENGSAALLRCFHRNVPAEDMKHRKDVLSLIATLDALWDKSKLYVRLLPYRSIYLRDNEKEYNDMCALARRFLRRFHVETPKELL